MVQMAGGNKSRKVLFSSGGRRGRRRVMTGCGEPDECLAQGSVPKWGARYEVSVHGHLQKGLTKCFTIFKPMPDVSHF